MSQHARILVRSQRPDDTVNAAKYQYSTKALPLYTVIVYNEFIYLICFISHCKSRFSYVLRSYFLSRRVQLRA